ncbi:hypothetical protein CDAR_557251 [Caerostris darwini]|uniref:Uncharacterized protein n=1 Tax=Caerostris darwini TaxID=1538125 RepID=A0AAV4P7G8_9ARAC|nr:hypothetical protein CDAR_557251 [Caerostris darwini]
MSGRDEEPPGTSETMDLSPAGDEAKRLSETNTLPDPPAIAATPILYAHAEELVHIIQLKARLAADWIRPAACKDNPELAGGGKRQMGLYDPS